MVNIIFYIIDYFTRESTLPDYKRVNIYTYKYTLAIVLIYWLPTL